MAGGLTPPQTRVSAYWSQFWRHVSVTTPHTLNKGKAYSTAIKRMGTKR